MEVKEDLGPLQQDIMDKISSVQSVLETGVAPRTHGWPSGPGAWNRFGGQSPQELLEQAKKQITAVQRQPLDDGINEHLAAAYLHEVWLCETHGSLGDANTIEIAIELIEGKLCLDTLTERLTQCGCRFPERMAQKVLNLYAAVVFILATDEPLTEILVRIVHEMIAANGLIDSPGVYREKRVCAQGCNLEYLLPKKIPARLRGLIAITVRQMEEADTLAKAVAIGAVFFSEFLLIHPFNNGNGRTARLLLNQILRSHVVIPFTLCGHVCEVGDIEQVRKTFDAERAFYVDVLNLRNNKSTPPSVLAAYILQSIQRTASNTAYIMS
jgi:hypothetical protein